MDNYNDNKATPKKRTGENENNNSDSVNDKNTVQEVTPEIIQPHPATVTPAYPAEMPARDVRTEL